MRKRVKEIKEGSGENREERKKFDRQTLTVKVRNEKEIKTTTQSKDINANELT